MTQTQPGRTANGVLPAGTNPPGTVGEPDLRSLLAGLTAVRGGDFGTRLPDDADGLLGEIAGVFNGMVDQLSAFADEVTRVAREVGSEGRPCSSTPNASAASADSRRTCGRAPPPGTRRSSTSTGCRRRRPR